jgi:hypothetical protein
MGAMVKREISYLWWELKPGSPFRNLGSLPNELTFACQYDTIKYDTSTGKFSRPNTNSREDNKIKKVFESRSEEWRIPYSGMWRRVDLL